MFIALGSERGHTKLLWLTIDRVTQKWTYPVKHWDLVIQQFAVLFEDRVPLEAYGR